MKKLIIKFLLILSILTPFLYIQQTNAIKVNTIISLSPMINECKGGEKPYCEFGSWTEAIMKLLGGIIKYITFIVWLLAVLFIVVNGIMYSMGWMDQSMKEEAKKRITKTLIGIIILLMTWTILKLIAPWIYK